MSDEPTIASINNPLSTARPCQTPAVPRSSSATPAATASVCSASRIGCNSRRRVVAGPGQDPRRRQLRPEIVRGIKGCKVLLLMCSDAALRSRNVKQEIQLAWKYERPYLPLLLEPTSFPEQLEYWLEAGSGSRSTTARRSAGCRRCCRRCPWPGCTAPADCRPRRSRSSSRHDPDRGWRGCGPWLGSPTRSGRCR